MLRPAVSSGSGMPSPSVSGEFGFVGHRLPSNMTPVTSWKSVMPSPSVSGRLGSVITTMRLPSMDMDEPLISTLSARRSPSESASRGLVT